MNITCISYVHVVYVCECERTHNKLLLTFLLTTTLQQEHCVLLRELCQLTLSHMGGCAEKWTLSFGPIFKV